MIELKIYVPAPGTWQRRNIKAGSGIVGSVRDTSDGNRICIDYEGSIHGQRMTWNEKVFHAAGRHVAQYPTVARAWVKETDLIEVGVFRCNDKWKDVRIDITDSVALDAWRLGDTCAK